jgi:CheY-like chemotaxis protein
MPRPIAAPDPGEPGPDFDRERLVVVAHADAETSKTVAEALEQWGLQVLVAYDGVEAILSIQRSLPRVVVLDAALPKMYGFQVCEVVKRNESLRETRVVLVGAVHKEDRYRRAPRELYGADVYVEPPDLPDALHGILTGFGVDLRSADGSAVPNPPSRPQGLYGHVARGGRAAALDTAPVDIAPPSAPAVHRSAPNRPIVEMPAPAPRLDPAPTPVLAPAPTPPEASDPLAAERAKAERLARIIVSDIALYNPEKFAAAARRGGDALAAMRDELEEGRALFRERIDARVRNERDHLAEELARAVKARSGT